MTLTRIPCFTSNVPMSCRNGRHFSYSSRSSATCFERRMCPASPQSITRLAMLMPAPARLARSFTSTTPLTGPLWIPIRSCRRGCSLSARLISTAHCAGASGSGVKDQRHPVASWDLQKATGGFGFGIVRRHEQSRSVPQPRVLLVNRKL